LGCTCAGFFKPLLVVLINKFNKVALAVRGPEKAGVGGSIPSLATIFLKTYRQSKTEFHSISFQKNGPPGCGSGTKHCSETAQVALITNQASASRNATRRARLTSVRVRGVSSPRLLAR